MLPEALHYNFKFGKRTAAMSRWRRERSLGHRIFSGSDRISNSPRKWHLFQREVASECVCPSSGSVRGWMGAASGEWPRASGSSLNRRHGIYEQNINLDFLASWWTSDGGWEVFGGAMLQRMSPRVFGRKMLQLFKAPFLSEQFGS